MLTNLTIKNFAIIDGLDLNIQPGLTTITGETGAGKSIILGALKLVLGERADHQSLKNNEKKCVIEATFFLDDYSLTDFFSRHDLDYEKETLIRREISPNGKSRAFINDTPITLSVLKELTEQLIDIHAQFDTRELVKQAYVIGILDHIAEQKKQFHLYQNQLKSLREKEKTQEELLLKFNEHKEKEDYNRFLLEELEEASFSANELVSLEEEHQLLNNADGILTSLSQCLNIWNNEEIGIERQLHQLKKQIEQATKNSDALEPLNQRMQSIGFELTDLMADLEMHSEKIASNPQRLSEVQERINLHHTLLTKHQCQNVEQLVEIQRNLRASQNQFDSSSQEIDVLSQEITELKQELNQLAEELQINRKKSAKLFCTKTLKTLSHLGMDKSQMDFSFTPLEELSPLGKNKVQILFSANPGQALLPIEKGASGGELSRIMLAIKKITAEHQKLPTLILDEIDTGISGPIAHQMGKIMQDMAQNLQLICITHLAQIAAKGNNQLKIKKEVINGQTQTQIQTLNPEKRLTEIATLISGSHISEHALKQAKELLDS